MYTPAPRKRRTWIPVVLGIFAFLAVLLCAGTVTSLLSAGSKPAGGKLTSPPAVSVSVPPVRGLQSRPTAKVIDPQLTSGNWEVPSEARPGIYRTKVGESDYCYWARVKSFDGEFSSIISNGNLTPGSTGRILVKADDKGLVLTGGCIWVWSKK